MPMTARSAALTALGEYRRNSVWPDAALDKLFARSEISERDIALTKRIVGGVIQNMTLCDYYVSHFSTMSLKKIEPRVLDILRMSIYQLVFLTKIPQSAAVNEGVLLAKKHANPRAVGFVNALLRKVAAAVSADNLPEVTAETAYQRLSIKYSHPEWLVREVCEELGQAGAEAFLSANNVADTPIIAQVNTLCANPGEVLENLQSAGVQAERHKWLTDAIMMRRTGSVERLDVLINGHIYIQDPAARLAVIAAAPKPGDFVIDACAAPGGKSYASAIAMKNTGRIDACDINRGKLGLIESGAGRLGLSIISASEKDASVFYPEYADKADVVIADVPCSGFGVIRKKPEIRYKSEADIAELPALQKRILANVSRYVKPGGTLLYSTCTILKRENEDVIVWFLEDNDAFYREAFTAPGIGSVENGMITLWPHIHDTDGFFICKLRRRA
ncbi:MAG: 16S rRNA (cytosine(967)-C(5))-methyltransferase RsmB [Oscillospiraceae bacterium]|nr:16S rRNA (cytosine(967)-C(5))-methyltransferase RsmB [Oscillospiraceae bacterium]